MESVRSYMAQVGRLPEIARDCPRLHEIARDCPRLPEIARDCVRSYMAGGASGPRSHYDETCHGSWRALTPPLTCLSAAGGARTSARHQRHAPLEAECALLSPNHTPLEAELERTRIPWGMTA